MVDFVSGLDVKGRVHAVAAPRKSVNPLKIVIINLVKDYIMSWKLNFPLLNLKQVGSWTKVVQSLISYCQTDKQSKAKAKVKGNQLKPLHELY